MVLRPIRASGGRTGASVCSGDCGLCCKERVEKVQAAVLVGSRAFSFAPSGLVLQFSSPPTARAVGCILSLLRGFYCSNRSRLLLRESKDGWPLKNQVAARFLQKPEGNRDGQRISVRGLGSWSSCWAAQALNGDAGAGACTRVSLGANSSEDAKCVPIPVAISAEDAIH